MVSLVENYLDIVKCDVWEVWLIKLKLIVI